MGPDPPPQSAAGQAHKQAVYRHLGDVRVPLSVELGQLRLPLARARRLQPQDVIVLEKLAGEAFEVRANGYAFALGEIVVDAELLTCRITQFIQQPRS
jgi:flagellar motor switch protein FliN/FliY